MRPTYSFIVPIYNRPEELRELLESISQLSGKIPFEVIVVEDGSTISSEEIAAEFSKKLNIRYFYKENTGPGDSRNFGMKNAHSDYFLILDSDVLLPPQYLQEVNFFLKENHVECFGGRDAAHESFGDLQKAINYVMTSFLTTGGIRGDKKAAKNFEPRSFNMGISRKAFEATGGFGKIHPGEDPDLSLRIKKMGFSTAFAPKVFVYHKRRIDWQKFYVQVNKFGKARPILTSWHRGSEKLVFWLPGLFMLALLFSIILSFFSIFWPLGIYIVYFLVVFLDAAIKNKSIFIGILALRALLTQFFGYGLGFFTSTFYIRLLRKEPKNAFPDLFF
ncbi:MAG TPA: glycosyltransferase [Flavobacteriaceae bacterium]|nr:glycosyltransferase [Flavobacteriaceae bacterium]